MTAPRPWDPSQWPRPGCCGACGRPAWEAPSGRWWHDGRPYPVRSQGMRSVDDIDIKFALAFVPAGEPLPKAPSCWHMHPTETNDSGIPTAFDVCNTDHTHTVRQWLAQQAEETQ